MKAPARLFLPLLVILFCCNKPHETTRTPTPPQQLTTNVTSVSLSGNLNARDSVAVQSNGKWTLNVSPASATWLTPSTTAGNGNTTVYLTANAENKSGADRTATVVITPESATTQPVSLTVTQRPYTLSFTAAWSKLYGGTKGDIFNSVVRSPDGGYIAVGYTQSSDGDVTGFKGANDAWAMKVDAAGNKVWTKTYGGSGGDGFSWITPATDGGYIIAGATTSSDGDVSGQHGSDDAWLMKIDENGNTLWQKAMGGSSQDVFTSVIPSNDGGYIAVGNTTSTDGDATGHPLRDTDVWVVKTDAAGDKVWAKYYGGSGFDHAVSVVAGPGGGYAVCGLTTSNDGDVSGNHGGFADVWVFKIDEAGGKQWQKTLGTSDADQGFSITAAGDGYVVLGSVAGNDGDVTANHGMNDYWLVKLDASGGKVWQKTYGGSGSDAPYVLKASSDGGYILCGSSNSTDGDLTGNKGGLDLWMLKVDAGGGKVWSKTFGGASDDYAKSFIPTPDNGYLIAGYSKSNDADVSGNHGDWDGWLVRINVQ